MLPGIQYGIEFRATLESLPKALDLLRTFAQLGSIGMLSGVVLAACVS